MHFYELFLKQVCYRVPGTLKENMWLHDNAGTLSFLFAWYNWRTHGLMAIGHLYVLVKLSDICLKYKLICFEITVSWYKEVKRKGEYSKGEKKSQRWVVLPRDCCRQWSPQKLSAVPAGSTRREDTWCWEPEWVLGPRASLLFWQLGHADTMWRGNVARDAKLCM